MFGSKGRAEALGLLFLGLVSSGVSDLLPLPTVGQVFTTATANPATHPLGGVPVPTQTSFLTSIDFNSIVLSSFQSPPEIDIPKNITFSNPSIINSLFPAHAVLPHIRGRAANPTSVDWRNRWGIAWLANIKDQYDCENCWIFGATALVETMVRIQHGMWAVRSEGDIRGSMGVSCESGGSAEAALTWATGAGPNGISDLPCVPYRGSDDVYYPCSDRSGRTVRIPTAHTFSGSSSTTDQKSWINLVGPLTAQLDIHTDWDAIPQGSTAVYKWDGKSPIRGRHVVLIVGYDDTRGCWIVRNSWGPNVADHGYYYVGYGQVTIDSSPKTGITNVSPDPWSRKRHHNGVLYQSGNGATHRNFEMVRNLGGGVLEQVWRNGGDGGNWAWGVGGKLLTKGPNINGQPVITGTSMNRDFELLYWQDGGYFNHWFYSQISGNWFNTGLQGNGHIAGYPGFTELSDSTFAVAARNDDGSLWEWARPTPSDSLSFQRSIATGVLQSGPSLVQTNVGTPGLIYVVAVMNTGKMQMFWRDPATNNAWQAGETFGSGIGSTPPVMVQSFWSTADENAAGPLELCIAVGGQVQHWQRAAANPGATAQWNHVFTFGSNIKHVWGLVHGSFNQALEMVVEDFQGQMHHWQYTNAGWAATAVIPS